MKFPGNYIGKFESACNAILIIVLISLPSIIFASSGPPKLDYDWGGHVKARGGASWPDDDSYYKLVGIGTYYDGSFDSRLKNRIFYGDNAYFETHYEAILSGGDTRRKARELSEKYGYLIGGFLSSGVPEDDRRFMDLTKIISDKDDHIVYHRLDRFALNLQPDWGTICIGRQALTWGNGLLFNPMDLFNPFAPTDIERDYKIGDDMATIRFSVEKIGELQFLYTPRRDPETGDVKWDQSSVAGKLHLSSGTTEFDLMAAGHYEDFVLGFGSMGYVGGAAWRMDAVWTFLEEEDHEDGFLSLVANLDYSWVWWNRNFYGLIEFYFNGLGDRDYSEAYLDERISERLARGEIFTLGRTYLAGEITMEPHPLFNIYLTVINNLGDPSGIIQPRGVWDIAENTQLTGGANLYYGRTGTEYGGFKIPYTDLLKKPANSVFIWLTRYF